MQNSFKTLGLAVIIVSLSSATGWVAGRISAGALHTSGFEVETIETKNLKGTTSRRALYVPPAYGTLTHVTPTKAGWTLWFENRGEIRNVFIEDGLVVVRRGGKVVNIGRR